MKEWTTGQKAYICAHLGVDMTGDELGRLFMVNPAEIHQVYRAHRGCHAQCAGMLTAFHSPGGIRIWANTKGATIKDAYLVRPSYMAHAEWMARFDADGFLKPEFQQ